MLSSASDLLELTVLNIIFRYKFDLEKGRKQNATELTEPIIQTAQLFSMDVSENIKTNKLNFCKA
jgi:hypothetical protein